MNKDLLGKCRACGQMISKNLIKHVGGFVSNLGCPHCGEASPHWTKEDEIRQLYEEREKLGDEKEILLDRIRGRPIKLGQLRRIRKKNYQFRLKVFSVISSLIVLVVILIWLASR